MVEPNQTGIVVYWRQQARIDAQTGKPKSYRFFVAAQIAWVHEHYLAAYYAARRAI